MIRNNRIGPKLKCITILTWNKIFLKIRTRFRDIKINETVKMDCHNIFSLKNQCTKYANIYIKGSMKSKNTMISNLYRGQRRGSKFSIEIYTCNRKNILVNLVLMISVVHYLIFQASIWILVETVSPGPILGPRIHVGMIKYWQKKYRQKS